jgi:sugar lactone lactonase YvrE
MGAGSVMRVRQDGSTTTLIGGLWIPSGLEVIGDDVYVAQMLYGTVTRYSGIAPQSCVGDLNGDGRVDGGDMGILLAAWGLCS